MLAAHSCMVTAPVAPTWAGTLSHCDDHDDGARMASGATMPTTPSNDVTPGGSAWRPPGCVHTPSGRCAPHRLQFNWARYTVSRHTGHIQSPCGVVPCNNAKTPVALPPGACAEAGGTGVASGAGLGPPQRRQVTVPPRFSSSHLGQLQSFSYGSGPRRACCKAACMAAKGKHSSLLQLPQLEAQILLRAARPWLVKQGRLSPIYYTGWIARGNAYPGGAMRE
mmetsp:Transcript_39773/g.93706  ORF Transcript_39773/g.93706 Transcript_39773/m.93706 type:complete len:223 (+) Transcript_39773:406-1074(+)